jgi:hypothetical protein
MHLPGRLSSSTLGDLLGPLHRERITGTIELCEIAGPFGRGVPGRVHRVHLRAGLVVAVDTDLAGGRSADLRARMDALFSLPDAAVAFRTARPLSPSSLATPLGPGEFLHGRPRARDRSKGRSRHDDPPPSAPADDTCSHPGVRDPREHARRLLGIPSGAAVAEVRRAFRRMASALHPDRLASAAREEQERQAARFAELSAAYHLLVA